LERCGNSGEVVVAADERARSGMPWRAVTGESRDEAIAAAANVLNGVLRCAVVADRPTHLLDTSRQVRLGEKPMAPHAIEQVGLRHHSITVLDEEHEEIERLRFEVHRSAGASDLTACRIDLDVVEPVHIRSLTAARYWTE